MCSLIGQFMPQLMKRKMYKLSVYVTYVRYLMKRGDLKEVFNIWYAIIDISSIQTLIGVLFVDVP